MGQCVFRRGLGLGAALLLGLVGGQPAAGQTPKLGLDRAHMAVGYVANAPNMMAGVGGYAMFEYLGGIGLYLDAKFDIETPAGQNTFEGGLTVHDVVNQIPGAEFIERDYGYQSFNAAVVRPLNSELAVYVGGGLVNLTEYHLFQDSAIDSNLGVSGIFWVEDATRNEVRGNLMVGAFIRLSSFLSSQVGFETEPQGFTVGASFRLPQH